MKRVKSIVTVEGFEQSYVSIDKVLEHKGIKPNNDDEQEDKPELNFMQDETTGIFYTTVDDDPVIVAHNLEKVVVTPEAIAPDTALVATIILSPTHYHSIGDADGLTFLTVVDDTFDYSLCTFVGRFTANSDDVNITLPSSILPADSNPNIKSGHTYEYSIFDGVFSIFDVTVTPAISESSNTTE